jgi:hypothetical protein
MGEEIFLGRFTSRTSNNNSNRNTDYRQPQQPNQNRKTVTLADMLKSMDKKTITFIYSNSNVHDRE